MNTFLLAHASADHAQEALSACLSQLGTPPPEANFGFIYATDACAEELPGMLRLLKGHTGIEHWVGTVGMGICASGQEYYDQPALAIMIAAFPAQSFQILRGDVDDLRIPPADTEDGLRVAIVHGDPRDDKLGTHLADLPDDLGNGYLIGGLTSSTGESVQIADEPTTGPLTGVVFDASVPIISGLSQGCTPIGPARTLTESQRNIAVQIDARPALDVFYEDIGEILARDLQRVAGYIFAGFPVPGSDSGSGDYLVRNLVGVDPTNRLLAIGDHLHEGDPILFCRRDGQSAIEDLQRMLADIKSRLTGPVRGAVYYSCLGRGRSLFGDDSEELKLIRDTLGDIPLVGFFANGEISGNRLYGYTGVLSLFL